MTQPSENLKTLSRCQIQTALREVFGSEFDVVAADDETSTPSVHIEIAEQTEAQRFGLTISGLELRSTFFKVSGSVEAINEASVRRSAEAVLKILDQDQTLHDMNDQLEYFMQQVTVDLEEACWFRTMADEVSACRADEPVSSLCDRILPQLRTLLHARSATIIMEEPDGSEPTVVGFDAPDETTSDLESTALRVSELFREEAEGEAFVWNRDFVNSGDGNKHPDENVDAFILVQIRTVRRHFGWLVAVNRLDPYGTVAQSRRSESEFGTHEATLMETAAVLLATHAANTELFDQQEETLLGVVTAMVNALDARDPYTRGHSHRVALVSRRIGQQLDLSEEELEDIYLSGLLHDIGKIGVADHVLLKEGPLDVEERKQIERHADIGHAILSPVRQLSDVLPGVRHHHEQIDGSGYPFGLSGNDIPLPGRILAVADAYDAMTTCRPYRKAMPIQQAEAILLEGAGSHWDEEIIVAFFEAKADIENVYEDRGPTEDAAPASALQFGRFEDASLAAVAELTPVSDSE